MLVDREQKVDTKMLEANIKMQEQIKRLKYDVEILEKKLNEIDKMCKTIKEVYPDCEAFASRIIFIINNN